MSPFEGLFDTQNAAQACEPLPLSSAPTMGLLVLVYCDNLGSLSVELLTMHRLRHSHDFDSMRIEASLITFSSALGLHRLAHRRQY